MSMHKWLWLYRHMSQHKGLPISTAHTEHAGILMVWQTLWKYICRHTWFFLAIPSSYMLAPLFSVSAISNVQVNNKSLCHVPNQWNQRLVGSVKIC